MLIKCCPEWKVAISGAFHRNDFDWSDVDRYAQPSYYADGRLDNNGKWYLPFRDGMTEGLPLVIEMGIFLDVLIAVMVLVILTNRLRLSFMTTDTNVLRKLKG